MLLVIRLVKKMSQYENYASALMYFKACIHHNGRTDFIRVSHAWYEYRSAWGNNSSIDAADFIQYVNDNRDVLHTKCGTERINETKSFTNEDIQELVCIFNAQGPEFSTNIG